MTNKSSGFSRAGAAAAFRDGEGGDGECRWWKSDDVVRTGVMTANTTGISGTLFCIPQGHQTEPVPLDPLY